MSFSAVSHYRVACWDKMDRKKEGVGHKNRNALGLNIMVKDASNVQRNKRLGKADKFWQDPMFGS